MKPELGVVGVVGVVGPPVAVRLASEISKNPAPLVKSPECTIRRTWLLDADNETSADPLFAVSARSSVGKVKPPSVDIRTLTVAALTRTPLVPPTFHVTVVEPERLSPPFGAVSANGPAAPATLTTVSSVLTPPPAAELSRTVARKLIAREVPVGTKNCDQHNALFRPPSGAAHNPFWFVFPAATSDRRGKNDVRDVVGANERNSGPAEICGSVSADTVPPSRWSKLYVNVSPSASLPAAVKKNGVWAGTVTSKPALAVGTLFPVGAMPTLTVA